MTAAITSFPAIRCMQPDAPWRWLAAGWRDMMRIPSISFTYGILVAAASIALLGFLFYLDLPYLFLPLAAAFMFVGPMLAVELYEASRRVEAGLPVGLFQVAFVATKSPTQLAWLGLILMLFLLAWVRFATLLFALFFGTGFPPLPTFVTMLVFTYDGLIFLAIGTIIGAGLALTAFAISAVSVPLLMARDCDAITAIIVSVRAVLENFWTMMVWAWLIALLSAVGIATLFVGLIVTFPLVGHATWHAYRELVNGDAAH